MKEKPLAWLTLLLLVGVLLACGPQGPSVRAEDVWARPATGAGGNGAVFLTLVNDGGAPDRLVAAHCDVAEAVEIHQTIMENDVMKMQPVEGGIEVPAGGKAELKPGGYHIMLITLKRDLQEGEELTVQLDFEKSGSLTVQAKVRLP